MGIVEDVKEAVKLAHEVDNMPLYRKLLDLQAELIEVSQELKEKDNLIDQLNKALSIKGKLVCENSAYYLMDDTGNKIDGPFCTKCFDVDHLKCRLVRARPEGRRRVKCLMCKVEFDSYPTYNYLASH